MHGVAACDSMSSLGIPENRNQMKILLIKLEEHEFSSHDGRIFVRCKLIYRTAMEQEEGRRVDEL